MGDGLWLEGTEGLMNEGRNDNQLIACADLHNRLVAFNKEKAWRYF